MDGPGRKYGSDMIPPSFDKSDRLPLYFLLPVRHPIKINTIKRLITIIAVIICLILLAVKSLIDSAGKTSFLRFSRTLVWFIIPLLALFVFSMIVRISNGIPDLFLIF
jgi:hypothetical protein